MSATDLNDLAIAMTFLIREATLDDAVLIAELTRQCWHGKVAASSSGNREAPQRVREDLQQGGGFLLLNDNTPAGSIRWLAVVGDPLAWEVARMGILPPYRGQGLWQQLMAAVVARALSAGIRQLQLAVRTDAPRLLSMYGTLGFDIAAELKYSHANPLEPAPIVMRRLLHGQKNNVDKAH